MISEAYANILLDQLYGSGTPATLYAGLFISTPGPDGTGGTEVSGGSYARKAITNNSTNFPAAADGIKSNGTAITFATATADWGSVDGVGIFSAPTGGTLYDFGDLDNVKTVLNGDVFSFAIGQLTFKFPQ